MWFELNKPTNTIYYIHIRTKPRILNISVFQHIWPRAKATDQQSIYDNSLNVKAMKNYSETEENKEMVEGEEEAYLLRSSDRDGVSSSRRATSTLNHASTSRVWTRGVTPTLDGTTSFCPKIPIASESPTKIKGSQIFLKIFFFNPRSAFFFEDFFFELKSPPEWLKK